MRCKCLSIEADADFSALIQANKTITLAYPIYCSRAPRIMREFVSKHAPSLRGKQLVILVTQWMFSGDGARSLTDLFEPGHVNVIYAEHFNMPNNICNMGMPRPTEKDIQKYVNNTEAKLERVCRELRAGTTRKRGFNPVSRMLGIPQGLPWLGGLEQRLRRDVKINDYCKLCGLCTEICPTGNFSIRRGKVVHHNNCTQCYRCVNNCPSRAITVMIHKRPTWQYRPTLD